MDHRCILGTLANLVLVLALLTGGLAMYPPAGSRAAAGTEVATGQLMQQGDRDSKGCGEHQGAHLSAPRLED